MSDDIRSSFIGRPRDHMSASVASALDQADQDQQRDHAADERQRALEHGVAARLAEVEHVVGGPRRSSVEEVPDEALGIFVSVSAVETPEDAPATPVSSTFVLASAGAALGLRRLRRLGFGLGRRLGLRRLAAAPSLRISSARQSAKRPISFAETSCITPRPNGRPGR